MNSAMDLMRLESWQAQVTLYAAAPDAELVPALASETAALAEQAGALKRPALRLLFVAIVRVLSKPLQDADVLCEASLAALEISQGHAAAELGLEPAMLKLFAFAGLKPDQAQGLLIHLRNERVSAAPEPEPEPAPTPASASANVVTTPAPIAAPGANVGPLYVSPEERELITASLEGELLNALAQYAAQPSPRAEDPDLTFLLGSMVNALDAVGLPCLAAALRAHAEVLDNANEPHGADALGEWLVLLMGWFADPDARNAEDLAAVMPAPQQGQALLQELNRVQFVLDPAHLQRPAREVSANDLDLNPAADVIPSVLQGMLRELPGHADALARSIESYGRSGDRVALDQARRTAHTLKGDANTVGIRGLANLTHALEDILVALDKRGGERDAHLLHLLAEAADCVAAMADAVLARGAGPTDADLVLARVYAAADALDRGEMPQAQFEQGLLAPAPTDSTTPVEPAAAAMPPTEAELGDADEVLSVSRQLLDRLLETSAEAVALANQLKNELEMVATMREELHAELDTLARNTAALDEQVSLRGSSLEQNRRTQSALDPLELEQYNELYVVSRRLTESHADARARLALLEQGLARVETLSRQKGRLDEDVKQDVQRARLMRIREVSGRFERAVRQAGRSLEKGVDLRIEGDALSIDKIMLDGLIEPVMHLLRNAVDHGLEPTARRADLGKPENGQIVLKFSQQAQTLNIEVRDDGAGIDYARIAARGRELGVVDDDTALDESYLHSLLFLPGFSTRDSVSQLSGRGVGMDVVARRVQALGGSIEIFSETGRGSRFELALPLALGTLQVATLQLGEQVIALACDSFEQFTALGASEQRLTEDGLQAQIDGQWYPAIDGGRLFDLNPVVNSAEMISRVGLVIDLAGEGKRVVLATSIAALVTVVLKNLDTWLKPIRGIRGAAVLGDGRAATVVDLREFARARRGLNLTQAADFETALDFAPRVVVADDSLTVRRALGELLEDAGYAPELARDGLEALLMMERTPPRALLVDLEMPRMNGLELTSHLRRSPQFEHLPIIMITSRTSMMHVEMARESGVTEVLSKPYSDDELLNVLAAAIENAAAMEEARRA